MYDNNIINFITTKKNFFYYTYTYFPNKKTVKSSNSNFWEFKTEFD